MFTNLKLSSRSFIAAFLVLTAGAGKALSQPANASPAFDLSGKMQRVIFFEGNVIASSTNNFTVQVRGSSTRIKTWNVPSSGTLKAKDYEFITDGFESRFITTMDTSPDAVEESHKPGASKIFNSFVDVVTNSFPPNDRGFLGPIWLATASTTDLQRAGNGAGEIHPCICMTPDWPEFDGEKLKAQWSLSTKPPYLPEKLVEYADAKTLKIINTFYARWKKLNFPATYAGGYTNAVYEVLNWTNAGGLHFPQQFQMTGYIPQFKGSDSNQLQVQAAYSGIIESIKIVECVPEPLTNQFPNWSRITEHRYGKINGQPITYTSKSGALLTKEEIRQRNFTFDNSTNKSDKKNRRALVIGVLLSLLLFPACAFFMQAGVVKKHQKQ